MLEIACGTGRDLDHNAPHDPRWVLHGLDISSEILRSARAKPGMCAALAHGDACDFDTDALFGVAQSDGIILSCSLSLIPDWHRALAARHDLTLEFSHLHTSHALHAVLRHCVA